MKDAHLVEQVRSAMGELLPTSMAAEVALVADQGQSYAEEAVHLRDAAELRRHEYATGRMCLRGALSQLGVQPAAIFPDADGVPVIDSAYYGSISHSRGLCAAVAGPSAEIVCVGLDLEKTNRLRGRAIDRVVHQDELTWVQGDPLKASILFSAKEAFYKAQFARWRCTGNFDDLSLVVSEEQQSMRVGYIAERFAPELRARAAELQFSYRLVEDYVITLCSLSVNSCL